MMTTQQPQPSLPSALFDRIEATLPWTRILSVTAVALSGVIVLVGAAMTLTALLFAASPQSLLIGTFAVFAGTVCLLPAVALRRYNSGLQNALRLRTSQAVESALRRHRIFWLTSGIITAMTLVAYGVVISKTVVVPNYRRAVIRAKSKRTIADVRALGEAVERYAHDHHRYPEAASASELRRFLEPRYIATVPLQDGWRRPLAYQTRCGDGVCFDYAVVSAGADGSRESMSVEELFGLRPRSLTLAAGGKETTLEERLNNDVIYADGRFVQPAGGVQQ